MLKIASADRKEALAAAKSAGVKLLYDPDDDVWFLMGRDVPVGLLRFMPKQNATSSTWVLDVPFDLRKEASGMGAKWDAQAKAWTYSGGFLPPGLATFLPPPFSWEEHRVFEMSGKWIQRAESGSIKLRPHQETAKRAIVAANRAGAKGFLLADDVGLGKTYSAWSSVLELCRGAKVLIVAPLGVLPVWREAVLSMGDGDNQVLIINYDRLKKLFELNNGAKVKSLKGLARRASAMSFDLVIWDESHYLKSMFGSNVSARAKLALKLYDTSKFMIWLSATAGQNVLELGYLKPVLMNNSRGQMADWYKEHGFNVTSGNYGKLIWEPAPGEEARLNKLLFHAKPCTGLRRLPQEVAGWPELQRILFPVELDPEKQRLYNLAWKEFLKVLEIDRRVGKISTNAMVAALRLRQKASLLKVEATAALVEELVDSRRRVPVSVEFLDSLEAIGNELSKRKISFTAITGKTQDGEYRRQAFQSGKFDAILFTVKEGISLHQGQILGDKDLPRAQIVHDLRWSGIHQHQIDGRSHRDGQFCPVYWMTLKDTIEEKVGKTMLGKLDSMAGMMGDVKETLEQLMRDI